MLDLDGALGSATLFIAKREGRRAAASGIVLQGSTERCTGEITPAAGPPVGTIRSYSAPMDASGQTGGEKEGTVLRVDARQCLVDVDGATRECRIRGRLFREEKRESKPVAVGDRVMVARQPTPPDVIVQVLERRNVLARRRGGRGDLQIIAANVDQAVIMGAFVHPELNLRLIDRMLVGAECGGQNPVIGINKIDLLPDPAARELIEEIYAPTGYPVIFSSVVESVGIDLYRDLLKDRVTVLTGPSGVGKSSLLNEVQPGLRLKAAEVSGASGKGRHTTTAASLIPLEIGGWVVDTPGMREFQPFPMEPHELGHYFAEFRAVIPHCHFNTCTHSHEVACAVKQAVDEDRIHPCRYESYLRMLEEL